MPLDLVAMSSQYDIRLENKYWPVWLSHMNFL